MKRTSWLMRTATTFAALERSIKAATIPPGELYPSKNYNNQPSTGWINWQGWPAFEQQAQTEGQRDLLRAKTAITSPWVFADVQLIANIFSTSTLVVKERRGETLEDVDNHDLETIWESPNEHMGRSFASAFWAWSQVLAGKSFLYWVPDETGTQLMEVWPVPPWMITPIPDRDRFISGYAFKATQHSPTIIIPAERITYSHSVNLFDVRDGLSFLAAADTEIKTDLAASMWNHNFFSDNNGVPDGMISLSKDALDPDVERVRWELRDFFGGTQRGLAVARAGDMAYQEFGRSQKDMEFSQGREFASKVIGRTLGIPDAIWSELSNRANAEQAMRTLINGAVWPLLVRLSEDMNARRIGVVQQWYGDSFRVEFKDIRPDDTDAKVKQLAAYQPFYTLNELREMTGQEAFPNDDVRGLMLVAEISKGAPLPGTPAAKILEDAQAEKDEQAAQDAAAAVEAGTMPDPNAPVEAPVDDGTPLPDDIAPPEDGSGMAQDAAVKAQSAEERAMFAKMGGGKGPGKGYDKSKSTLTTHDEKAKGGGGGSSSGDHWSKENVEKRNAEHEAKQKKQYDEKINAPLSEDEKRGAEIIAFGDRSKGGVGQGAHPMDDKTIARSREIHTENRDKALANNDYDKAAKHQRELKVHDEADKLKSDSHAQAQRSREVYSDLQAAKKKYDKKPNAANHAALNSAFDAYADHHPLARQNEARAREMMGLPPSKKAIDDLPTIDDLELWQRKALKAFRAKGRAAVAFESSTIGPDEHTRISAALKAAGDVAAIKAAFKRDALDKMLDSVDSEARAWAEEATSE